MQPRNEGPKRLVGTADSLRGLNLWVRRFERQLPRRCIEIEQLAVAAPLDRDVELLSHLFLRETTP